MNRIARLGLLLLGSIGLASVSAGVAWSAPTQEMELRANVLTSQIPLTTDRIAELDPGRPNPHLRRWLLDRKLELRGMRSRTIGKGLHGVQGGSLESNVEIYLRPEGPWYSPISAFPCTQDPQPAFATLEGSRWAAQEASELWREMISRQRPRLAMLLSKVASPEESSVLPKANRSFQEWLLQLDQEWRSRVESEIRGKEWKRYAEQAKSAGFCSAPAKGKSPTAAPSTQAEADPGSWMDSELRGAAPLPTPSESGADFGTYLVRAPARRWEGYFSVRLELKVGEQSLNGQFLIDPGASLSTVSPAWLKDTGVPSIWVEVPEADPARIRIAAGSGKSGLAPAAIFPDVLLSNYPLSLHRFRLFETDDLFDEPESFAPCCSGVLGRDFLRRYVIEFRPASIMGKTANPLSSILIRPVQGFSGVTGFEWVEVRETPTGKLEAICSPRVRKLGPARVFCQNPETAITNAVGPIIYDLPHGRIWYSRTEIDAPLYANRSGLKLEFDYVNGSRALVVRSIAKTGPAQALAQAGLKAGTVIKEFDGLPTSDMDVWEVERRLSGVYGETVSLKWKTPQGDKLAPLKVFGLPLQK